MYSLITTFNLTLNVKWVTCWGGGKGERKDKIFVFIKLLLYLSSLLNLTLTELTQKSIFIYLQTCTSDRFSESKYISLYISCCFLIFQIYKNETQLVLKLIINSWAPTMYNTFGGGDLVTKLCLTLVDSMDCGLPGSSVHGISQARILEWVAISFSRGSSQPRDQTCDSCIAAGCFTAETAGKPTRHLAICIYA